MSPVIALAIAMGVASTALQLWRVLRGHAAGVSLVGWSLITAVNLSWAAYFFFIAGNTIIAVFDILFAFGAMGIVMVAADSQRVPHRQYVTASLLGAATIAVLIVIAPSIGAIAVGVLSTSMYAPQAWTAVTRLARQQTLDGVSMTTWAWNAVGSTLWLGVGISLDEMPAIISNATLVGLAAVTTLSVFLSRQQGNAVEVTGPRFDARRIPAGR